MPKKQRRRPVRRRRPDNDGDAADNLRRMDAAAQTLVRGTPPAQLRSELSDRELLLDEADRAAQLEPNASNLARYRAARSQRDVARRAVQLSDAAPPDPS
ncbi:MAG: hypothetical protein H0V51_02045 [Chloroflexi bacterium]|nr:hypothetical protein [Chloroflexota bacterium]